MDKPFAASRNSVSQIIVYTADSQHIAAIQGLQVDEIEMVGSRPDIDSNQPDSERNALISSCRKPNVYVEIVVLKTCLASYLGVWNSTALLKVVTHCPENSA